MKKNDVGYIGSQYKCAGLGQRLYDVLGGKVFQMRTGARLFLSSSGRDLSFRFPMWAGKSGANHCRILPDVPGCTQLDDNTLFTIEFRHVGTNRTVIMHARTRIPLNRLRDIYESVTGL